jgi:NADH-quinone oxidoreductase subunit H
MYFIFTIIKSLSLLIPLLIAVAYFTLLERKVLASIQQRKGPNIVGINGLIQPFADGLKLFLKEIILPTRSNKILFLISPFLSLFISLLAWSIIPLTETIVICDINLGLLFLLVTSGIGVYGIILSGWTSNSKYAFLGCLRSAAQMISYEVTLSLILLTVVVCAQSLSLVEIVKAQFYIYFFIPLFPFFIMWIIAVIAETNRPPFDLPEAEAELVAGYNVEYAAMGFAYFFIAEYANILLISAITVICFFGGWLPIINIKFFFLIPAYFWFSIKLLFILFLFIWVRAAFPRYRFDQLMFLSWRIFLPLSICGLILISSIIWSFNCPIEIIYLFK